MDGIRSTAALAMAVAAAVSPHLDSPAPDPDRQAVVRTIAGPLNASGGISVGTDGSVYVADYGGDLYRAGGTSVYRLSPDGSVETFVDGFGGAAGNAVDRDGLVHQADIARGRVYRIGADGHAVELARGLESPVGVAVSGAGTVFVTECRADAVSRLGDGAAPVRIVQGPPLACPNGLALGGDGALYAANFRDGRVVRIAPGDGSMQIFATLPGGGNGHIAFHDATFFVASFRGNRIYAIDEAGSAVPLAGSGVAGNDDGPAASATFFRPNGVAVAPTGRTLYVNTTAQPLADDNPALHPNLVRTVSLRGE